MLHNQAVKPPPEEACLVENYTSARDLESHSVDALRLIKKVPLLPESAGRLFVTTTAGPYG